MKLCTGKKLILWSTSYESLEGGNSWVGVLKDRQSLDRQRQAEG